ncbi:MULTISPECIES: ATP-binding cassette domain-containing protein [Rhizobium]|jgi:simple sugar transport system ATP-binding protein|uniref:ABC transporter ATP-binding protein n=2 Tax=Rhizobium grahamii TaxID=1120045 RepID=A0A370KRA4_9HYPH|nr:MULTISPECIES: ATP-binding cassette domain-containing protein [Rhizobium]EPE98315.1 ABC transporter ATP-binding protein [Rhizobium grahamii CCGE 502]MBO9126758.1 sugar ABC transporter ATP-binding protein [Rhizobium sp. 16-488-2b]MBO9177205.1 sugar ABC transporter ATP-binding protein [Rhizobium sp. 16-488-2a]MBO9196650.1 sugar ABC transporter ATP-binding protein [Rhizobium sp. 16-449-1b]MDM9648633.1 ATP-binding cassette domain-containing protein [Rhizobium sp. S163]
MSAPNLLELHNISKSFGALTALRNLSFHIGEGEVVGLLGDNGAGKSTTVNLISGIHKPTDGYLSVDGKKTAFTCRSDSADAGIETIYQHTALVDSLSITRNIFMGRELTDRFGFLRQREMREIAMEVLQNAVHISGIDSPDTLVGNLSGGQKQAVAIARAVYFKKRVLLLDEPTSALSVRETEALLNQVLKLKAENVSSVLVTHNIYHAYQVCDRFVIMSHGTKVFDVDKADTTINQLTEYVVLT